MCIARDVSIPVCWIKYSVPDFVASDGSAGYTVPLLINTSTSLAHQVSFLEGQAGAGSTTTLLHLESSSGSLSDGAPIPTSQADGFYAGWRVRIFAAGVGSTYEERTVQAYAGAILTATLDEALSGSAAGRRYEMEAVGFTTLGQQVCGDRTLNPHPSPFAARP